MAHIVILDDVEDVGIMVKRILERKGHRVAVFTEEELAVAYVRSHEVDAAILDIKLKKMTGIDVLEEMQNHSPRTRVIMLTGYPTLETARESLKRGALEYLIKPVEKRELEEKVERVLEGPGGPDPGR